MRVGRPTPGHAVSRVQRYAVWLCALLPVALALLWGPYVEDQGFLAIIASRNLVSGRDLAFGLAQTGYAPWRFPLVVLLLSSLERLSVPLVPILWLFGAIGWGCAVYAGHRAVRVLGHETAAPVVAALLGLSPLAGLAVGGIDGWVVALFWSALAYVIEGRKRAAAVALALWLGCFFDWTTWLGLTAFVIGGWLREKRLPWAPALVWAVAFAGLLGGWVAFDLAPVAPQWGGRALVEVGRQWLLVDFYWLLLPLAALGALSGGSTVMLTLLGWGIAALGSGAPVPIANLYAAGAIAAGLGCMRLSKRGLRDRRDPVADHVHVGLSLLIALPLIFARGSALYAAKSARPVALSSLQADAGEWVRTHSAAGDVVWGDLRAGVAARRPVIVWTGESAQGEAIMRELAALSLDPPAFCVSSRSLGWDRLTRTGWFDERYQPVQQFDTPTDGRAPVRVWRYREEAYDRGEVVPLDVPLGRDTRVVGYRRWPPSLKPGDPVYLTLFVRAETPVEAASWAIVRVYSPLTSENYAQVGHPLPTSVPVDWWMPGGTIAERFVLTTTATTPVGAYHLDLSVPNAGLDGLKLACVAVPWGGAVPAEATPVDTRFEGGIRLVAAELPAGLRAGHDTQVTLYWEAESAPAADVTVFIALLGPDGARLTGHDGMPMEGGYPTGAWQPGDRVPDTHRFPLPEELPAGTYTIAVGLYHPATMERLPAETSEGEQPPDRTIVLGSFTVQD